MKYKCAGIVLYNPDLKRLSENINSIYNQVDNIIIVDNGSKNFNDFFELYKRNKKVQIIKNNKNKGIATALNQLAKVGMDLGYEWILFLDQDSICDTNLMKEYAKYLNIKNLALLCPYIIDINKMTLDEYNKMDLPEISYLKWAITSASLVKIDTLFKLGGFDEYLFIDGVDIEYSKRLSINNYKQIRINKTYLLQEVGNAEVLKLKRPHMDMSGKWSWKPFYRSNHSLMRRYYMARNEIIIAKKYKKYGKYYRNISIVLLLNISRIIIEKNKFKVMKSVLKGLKDGFKYPVKIYEVKDGKEVSI